MDKGKVTLFLVSSSSGRTLRLHISQAWIKTLVFIAVVLTVALSAGMVDYFGLILQSFENKRLRQENAQLVKQFQIVETKVSSLENSLERVKTFTSKLKLITNIEGQDRITKLSMGVKPAPNQHIEEYEPMEDRPPLDTLAGEDPTYENKAIPSEETGDIAAERSKQDYASLVVRIDRAVNETKLREQSVIDLWESLSERQSLLNAIPNVRPAKGWITSRFGYRINPVTGRPAMHAGLDIAASPGSPVYAPADGIVIFASYDESYGKLVSIDHGYGVTTRFGHNSQVYVHVGQKVSKYDVIASVGNTGRSTGPHVHYEVRVNSTPVDPANFILDD